MSRRSNRVNSHTTLDKRRWAGTVFTGACLLCIVLVGLALRLRNLGNECPWFDEYITLDYLYAPNLPAFLELIRVSNEPVAPLYPTLEYLVAHTFDCSWYGLRILSVVFGMLTIVAVFELGAVLFGRTAGLLAALAVSLNLTHVYYSQEIRMYALSGLLAALSMRSFVAFLDRRDRRTLALNTILNLLLVWNHPITLLLPFVQGLHLLAFKRNEWRSLAPWGLLQGLVAASILLWGVSRDLRRIAIQMGWLQSPHLFGLGPDEPSVESFFVFAMGTRVVMYARWLALVPPVAAAVYFWAARRAKAADGGSAERDPREIAGLLLLWLFVPMAALFVLSFVLKPCFTERYMLFLTFPIYFMLAGLVTFIRRPALKTAGIVAVVLLVTQSALVLPDGPFRRSFSPLAAHVRAHWEPGDEVVMGKNWLYEFEFLHYLGRKDLVVQKAESKEEFRKVIDRALARGAGVWVIGAQGPPVWPLVNELGYTCTGREWPGGHPLQLVRIPKQ